jgi:lipoprotein-releasing system permease protein
MRLNLSIARTHLLARKRQTAVSLSGIVLGVAFFLAVAALMRGSEIDFIERLIDTSPHITVSDEYRGADVQPVRLRWPKGAVELLSVKPQTEVRGIRGWQQKLNFIQSLGDLRVAPVMTGSVVLTFAGRIQGVTLSGIVPDLMEQVSTIEDNIVAGSLDALAANPNGIVIGQALAEKFVLAMGDNLNVSTPEGAVRSMKIVGIFRTGNAIYDEGQTFSLLKRAQLLFDRPNRVNRLIIQLDDPYRAREVARVIEQRVGYKSLSWLEANEDLMSVLTVRNTIMYSVVGAILVVASFGIYNTISTIVLEKTRDIAILKSMGFHGRDIRAIFITEGLVLGLLGTMFGSLLGLGLMWVLSQVKIVAPGMVDVQGLPIYYGLDQFLVAAAFALGSSIGAAYLPARKGARVQPVDILRGAA